MPPSTRRAAYDLCAHIAELSKHKSEKIHSPATQNLIPTVKALWTNYFEELRKRGALPEQGTAEQYLAQAEAANYRAFLFYVVHNSKIAHTSSVVKIWNALRSFYTEVTAEKLSKSIGTDVLLVSFRPVFVSHHTVRENQAQHGYECYWGVSKETCFYCKRLLDTVRSALEVDTNIATWRSKVQIAFVTQMIAYTVAL